MTQPAQQPSLGKRCLRLLEAVVWSGLAFVLMDWPSPAMPLCLFVIGVATAAPIGRPWIDEIPRTVTLGASCALIVGLASGGLTSGEGWNRTLVVLTLCVAAMTAGGFGFQARPRWAWMAAAYLAAVALFALDHQRVLAAADHAPGDDRLWWIFPAVLAAALPLSHFALRAGLVFIRRRAAAQGRAAWFRRPANLSSD